MTPSPPITTFGAPTGAGTDFSKFLRNLTSASTLTIEPDNATSTFMVAPLYAFERRLTPSLGLCIRIAQPPPGRSAPPRTRRYVGDQVSHYGETAGSLETLSADV